MFISERRTVFFGPAQGTGPREITDNVFFPRPVENLIAGLSGFSVSFVGAEEGRPFGLLVVELLETSITGNEVGVSIRFGLRDLSGDWDDAYTGLIDYVLYAELQDEEEFDERLTINDVEYNQAIQFFRAHLDLDNNSWQPNNAIPLVAGKDTAIRVYADYDSPNEDTILDKYFGELEVESSGQQTIITIDNMFISSARRDTSDNPISSDDDVPFFLIPAHLCHGDVKIRGRLRVVNEGGGEDSGWSPYFERTLHFFPGATVPVCLIGIRFGDIPGPTDEEAKALFGIATDMFPYPYPGFNFTNFLETTVSPPNNGTLHVNTILQAVLDTKGDATDEYAYGIISEAAGHINITGTENETVAGVAKPDISVAFSLGIAGGDAVAHEMGHILSLDHVNTGIEPGPFENYPKYGKYHDGSIGQTGFEPKTGLVHSPSERFDFMSYRDPCWISPHTCSKLLRPVGETQAIMLKQAPQSLEEVFFLSVTIQRNRSLIRHPSFHFPALRPLAPSSQTPFSVELADDCRKTLQCWPLSLPQTPSYCWPKTFFAQVPFPKEAKWLLIYENDTLIYEECIAPAPLLDLQCKTMSTGMELTWASNPKEDVWFLVQCRDTRGHWRGAAPRTQETNALVPFGQITSVRLLATSGIATSMVECGTSLPRLPLSYRLSAVEIRQPATRTGRRSRLIGWRATAVGNAGRSITGADFIWFDDRGRTLVRGPVLQVQRIPDDVREIVLMLRNRQLGVNVVSQRWRLRREGREYQLHKMESQSQDQSYSS